MTPIARIRVAGVVLAASTLAAQSASLPVKPTASLPKPQLVYKGQTRDDDFIYVNFGVANWPAYDPAIFAPAPQLPQCARPGTVSARSWVVVFDAATRQNIFSFCALASPAELDRLYISARRFGKPKPKAIFILIQDNLTKQGVVSNTLTIP